ncbi:hypothetical protein NP233_g7031 [Leucocoprinus birnbaumii]|uniref:Uncharacterized protein n=1 Tax=Leucocoprinus birnbaumii TaxID=56174 RepID=A0AAD5VPZ8_9AGAR|nr:hypothetical protein NP233_g7031 [Leucocoprinus birnbaumii]
MPTGAESIAQHLPQVRGAGAGDYYIVGSSGHSTSIARPPKTIIAFADNTFGNSLQSPALQQALQVQLNAVETESSHDLATEGDIERAGALYLVHDINLIIERGLLPRLNIPVNQFYCVGQSTSGTSRPDIKFVVNGIPVLILEYKRTNTLRESDWTGALVTADRTAQQIINDIPPGVQTALVDNAGIISKQASKYSSQCGLIVLCNYQNMIVLDFTPGNTAYNNLTNPVRYLFSSGTHLTHKQLLIAALIYGMRKAGVMGHDA